MHNPLDFEWVFCYILNVSTHEETMSFVKYKGYTREDALASVGAGWAGLINRVYDVLESIKGTVKIVQVKEKFGGLRIYTDYGNDELPRRVLLECLQHYIPCTNWSALIRKTIHPLVKCTGPRYNCFLSTMRVDEYYFSSYLLIKERDLYASMFSINILCIFDTLDGSKLCSATNFWATMNRSSFS